MQTFPGRYENAKDLKVALDYLHKTLTRFDEYSCSLRKTLIRFGRQHRDWNSLQKQSPEKSWSGPSKSLILGCVQKLLPAGGTGQQIGICSDSQAAVAALEAPLARTRLV